MMKNGNKTTKVINKGGPLGGVFFIMYFGALVYFIQQSDTFWGFLFAFVQAAIWPALVLYKVLGMLNI
jgi:hypothetical protein